MIICRPTNSVKEMKAQTLHQIHSDNILCAGLCYKSQYIEVSIIHIAHTVVSMIRK